jgi:hypothetical protein
MALRKLLLALAAPIVLPACMSKPPAASVGVTEAQGEAKPHVELRAELERIDDELTDMALHLEVATPPATEELQAQVAALKLRDLELRAQLQSTHGMINDVNVQRVNGEVERGTSALDMEAMRLQLAINPRAEP